MADEAMRTPVTHTPTSIHNESEPDGREKDMEEDGEREEGLELHRDGVEIVEGEPKRKRERVRKGRPRGRRVHCQGKNFVQCSPTTCHEGDKASVAEF